MKIGEIICPEDPSSKACPDGPWHYRPVTWNPNPQFPQSAQRPPAQPQRTPALGDRPAVGAQIVVSAAVVIVVLIALDTLLRIMHNAHYYDSYWIAILGTELLFVAVLAVWGRSAAQRVLGPIVALLFFAVDRGVSMVLMGHQDLAPDWFHRNLDVLVWISDLALLAGVVMGWSIARRRTGFSVIGLLPAAFLIVLGVWVDVLNRIPIVTSAWLLNTVNAWAPILVCAVLAVLIIWACDGIGIAARRSRRQPPVPAPGVGSFGGGYPPQYPQPGQAVPAGYAPGGPTAGPAYPGHGQWPGSPGQVPAAAPQPWNQPPA